MAVINNQYRSKISYLAWILLVAGAVALTVSLTRNSNEETGKGDSRQVNASANTGDNNPATTENNVIAGWDGIDFNTSAAQYEEVTNAEVSIRSTQGYTIYGVNETGLFAEGKIVIKREAEDDLTQVIQSIEKRYKNSAMRIYSYTDAQGAAGSTKELAVQRAAAVKEWLVQNGIAPERISINAVRKDTPGATNTTKQRTLSRRIEIVVRAALGEKSF